MNIVFNVNHLGMEGLGATLTSLCRNCSNTSQLKLWFFCSELEVNDDHNISFLLSSEKYLGLVKFIDFNAKEIFGHLPSLHGDWTTYGRLLISKYVDGDIALYLDADLIITTDVLLLDKFDLGDSLFGAVHGAEVLFTLDKSFFLEKLKWSSDIGYFNAGVMLFNIKKWNELNIDKVWNEIADQHGDYLISHDQTLLNAVSCGNFAHLLAKYNHSWTPFDKEAPLEKELIIHFVGSPKPWDLLGNLSHDGFSLWKSYNTSQWQKSYGKISFGKIRRTWKIKKSITKSFLIKIRK